MAPRFPKFADWIHSKRVQKGTRGRREKTLPDGLRTAPRTIQGLRAFTLLPTTKRPDRDRYVDAAFEQDACWMSLVNDALDGRKCNLQAFQHKGRVWFISRWKIRAGEELSVSYGINYPWKLILGDADVRGTAQQHQLFVGLILILIFSEVLGLYGIIVALILSTS